MSDRERWIVYPLLFLALGIALRNQFFPTRRFGAVDLLAGELVAHRICCNQLLVRDVAECNKVAFKAAKGDYLKSGMSESDQVRTGLAECRILNAGNFNVVNKEGKPLVQALEDKDAKSGFLQTLDSRGTPLVQLSPSEGSGMVTAWGPEGQALVALGHHGKDLGVFAQYPLQDTRTFLLTRPAPQSAEEKKEWEKKNDDGRIRNDE
jgi:hypothetical protein